MDDLLGLMSPLQASVCVCLSVSVQAYQEMYRAVQEAAEDTGSTLYKLLSSTGKYSTGQTSLAQVLAALRLIDQRWVPTLIQSVYRSIPCIGREDLYRTVLYPIYSMYRG